MNKNQKFSSTAEEIADDHPHNIKERQFLVTGATAGLGKETVRVLLKHGGIVTCACRNVNLMQEILNEYKITNPNQVTHIIPLDLTDFGSIRTFAIEYKEKVGKLDVLINNAGVMVPPLSYTKDGHEMQFGTNHLGHQMLTCLLQDIIISGNQPRIVNVSSMAHANAPSCHIKFDDIKAEKEYNDWERYGQSKLANIYFTNGLHKRMGSKVCCISLHPGVIKTELFRTFNGCLECMMWCVLGCLCMDKNIPQGTATQVQAAVSDQAKDQSGKQLDNSQVKKTDKDLLDDVENMLFKYSEEVTGEKIQFIN